MTLRARIFLSMIAIILLSSILMASITVYHFKRENEQYHLERLQRKEDAIHTSIDYFLQQDVSAQRTDSITPLFDNKICEVADVNKLDINIFDLEGQLLIASNTKLFDMEILQDSLDPLVIQRLRNGETRVVMQQDLDTTKFLSTYEYLNSSMGEPLAVINVPYFQTDSFHKRELKEFLESLAQIYVLLLIGAGLLAYFLSNYITSSLTAVQARIKGVRIDGQNERIEWEHDDEIGALVNEYNRMLGELAKSADLLAKSEREGAWKKMARQVAHEIKNPLTPMKLTVQQLERRLKPDDPEFESKMKSFTNTLVEQIDTLSSIASSFSAFAQMPVQNHQELELNRTLKSCTELFTHQTVTFTSEHADEVCITADKEYFIRVMNNLLTNAMQSIPEDREAKISVALRADATHAFIEVRDNGCGIPQEQLEQIFEPNFTTKSSGTGLGLAMVRNIVQTFEGTIQVSSEVEVGSTFTLTLPRASGA
ncbi:GHKL domain-containing protein [Cryomorphaceae bacterium]|nr:GHKL domain-containing protein [Cryomorphaceae bacterium]